MTAGAAGMVVIVLALGGNTASGATIPAVRIHGTVQTTQQHGTLDTALEIAQIVGIVAAVAALRFLAKQVKAANEAAAAAVSQATAANDQNRHAQMAAKRQRTTAFQEQYTSHEFAALNSRVTGYLNTRDARDAVQKIQAWETAGYGGQNSLPRTPRSTSAPKASKIDVVSVLGFYENMGAAYRLEQLDEEAFHRTFGPVPVLDFARAWWFICWSRNGRFRTASQPADYSEFEDLVRTTLVQKPSYGDYCKPKASIRVIALPDSEFADGVAWDLCGRLSQALSSSADLQFDLDSTASGRAGERSIVSRVIAIPNDLGSNACRWLKEIKAAEKLEERLRQLTRPSLEAALATVDA